MRFVCTGRGHFKSIGRVAVAWGVIPILLLAACGQPPAPGPQATPDDRAVIPARPVEPVEPVAAPEPPPARDTATPTDPRAAPPRTAPARVEPLRVEPPRDEPARTEAARSASAARTVLKPFPGVTVDVRASTVELDAVVCLDEGWLEQIACAPGTREHESLMVPSATPSQVHAALLAAGHRPGRPGRWEVMEPLEGEGAGRVRLVPPSGSRLRIAVRVGTGADAEEVPVTRWIRDHLGRQKFPDDPWVFGGSHIEPAPEWMREDGAGPEHYVADLTGSIIGLVTFGDEVIGFSRVLSDSAEVLAPEWEADTEHLPPVGTPVVIVIRPWQ